MTADQPTTEPGLKYNKGALLAVLTTAIESYDPENGHWDADRALLDFIGDADVREAYEKIAKWYA
jgi:hypothetical protein